MYSCTRLVLYFFLLSLQMSHRKRITIGKFLSHRYTKSCILFRDIWNVFETQVSAE